MHNLVLMQRLKLLYIHIVRYRLNHKMNGSQTYVIYGVCSKFGDIRFIRSISKIYREINIAVISSELQMQFGRGASFLRRDVHRSNA